MPPLNIYQSVNCAGIEITMQQSIRQRWRLISGILSKNYIQNCDTRRCLEQFANSSW